MSDPMSVRKSAYRAVIFDIGGAVDLEFALAGDYDDATREVRARGQSAHQGGVWLFLQRD